MNTIHPDNEDDDAATAFKNTLRSVRREGTGFGPQWVGVGIDSKGRLLQYAAINEGPDQWLIFHSMQATTKVLREVGLRR